MIELIELLECNIHRAWWLEIWKLRQVVDEEVQLLYARLLLVNCKVFKTCRIGTTWNPERYAKEGKVYRYCTYLCWFWYETWSLISVRGAVRFDIPWQVCRHRTKFCDWSNKIFSTTRYEKSKHYSTYHKITVKVPVCTACGMEAPVWLLFRKSKTAVHFTKCTAAVLCGAIWNLLCTDLDLKCNLKCSTKMYDWYTNCKLCPNQASCDGCFDSSNIWWVEAANWKLSCGHALKTKSQDDIPTREQWLSGVVRLHLLSPLIGLI